MKALITGVAGFSGCHLVARLRQEPQMQVFGLDIGPAAPTHQPLAGYWKADLSDFDQVRAVVRSVSPHVIFNLAGLAGGPAPALYRVNTLAAVNLLEAARVETPAARLLLIGSAAEYGRVEASEMPITEKRACNPVGAYGASKLAMTRAALDYAQGGLAVSVARPFNLIGAGIPRHLVVGAVLERALAALKEPAEPVVRVGRLDTERDYLAVEDAVDAYVRIAMGSHTGEVFNVCSGEPRTILSVIERLLARSPRPVRLETDPSLVRPGDVPTSYGSWEHLHEVTGFRPSIALDSAIETAWRYAIGSGQ